MYSVGDLIFYGAQGVCRVEEIGRSPFDKEDMRPFYVLKPLSDIGNATVYTPVETTEMKSRALMTKTQAEEIIGDPSSFGVLEVPSDKQRRETYRNAIRTGDPAVYVRLLNTVSLRRQEARLLKKHLPDMDTDFETTAGRALFFELATVLSRSYDEVAASFRSATVTV